MTDASMPPVDASGIALVVDDNLVNATLLCHLIVRHGRPATSCGSAREALRRIASGGIVAVFMDLRMPDMDGFDAARAIRAAERSSTTRLPIIAITADSSPGLRDQAIAAGMDELIEKPVSVLLVGAILTRFLPPGTACVPGQPQDQTGGLRSFDRAALRRAEEHTPGAAARILADLITGLATVEDAVPGLLARSAFLDSQRLAHACHACAVDAGADPLAEALGELESALRSGDRERCRRALRALAAARYALCASLAEDEIAWLPEPVRQLQAAGAGGWRR